MVDARILESFCLDAPVRIASGPGVLAHRCSAGGAAMLWGTSASDDIIRGATF